MPSAHRNFDRWHLDPSARGGVRNLLERATPASCALFVQTVKEGSEASDARRVGLSLHEDDEAEDRSFNEAARELEQRFEPMSTHLWFVEVLGGTVLPPSFGKNGSMCHRNRGGELGRGAKPPDLRPASNHVAD